ncbi:hypothetical protein GYH30_000272 [Glycine max]|nr:hypothetical protein GYH30_000272 [Glycine max]
MNRKKLGASSTATSASKRKGSSRTQLNTCGSRWSFFLAIPNNALSLQHRVPPVATELDGDVAFSRNRVDLHDFVSTVEH